MTYLKKYVYPWFVDMASFASIIGLVIAFVSDGKEVFIALVTFCLVLLILCLLVYLRSIGLFFVISLQDGR